MGGGGGGGLMVQRLFSLKLSNTNSFLNVFNDKVQRSMFQSKLFTAKTSGRALLVTQSSIGFGRDFTVLDCSKLAPLPPLLTNKMCLINLINQSHVYLVSWSVTKQ